VVLSAYALVDELFESSTRRKAKRRRDKRNNNNNNSNNNSNNSNNNSNNNNNNHFFVDLAANDPYYLSNTVALEVEGEWDGFCIEPNPERIESLLLQRDCQVIQAVVGSRDDEMVEFTFASKRTRPDSDKRRLGMYGGIVDERTDNRKEELLSDIRRLPSVSLHTLLIHAAAPTVIDYLSLDVEGAEMLVLKSFFASNNNGNNSNNSTRYAIMMMSVERPSVELDDLLRQQGLEWWFNTTDHPFGDCFYLHRDFPFHNRIRNSIRQKFAPTMHK
jgi:FkbM family methyltransferase